jgi:hypothetical protein
VLIDDRDIRGHLARFSEQSDRPVQIALSSECPAKRILEESDLTRRIIPFHAQFNGAGQHLDSPAQCRPMFGVVVPGQVQ